MTIINESFKLDLSDLEVERLDVTEAEGADIERLNMWTNGHGMTEIGASCCSCNTGDGSCGGTKPPSVEL